MPLRFGLTALEFQTIAQQIIVNGVPDFSRFDVGDTIRDAAAEGFLIIELSLDAKYILDSVFTPDSISLLADLKDELGLSYTVHLPLWSIELATFNEPVRRGSVESTVECIKATSQLEPETYVLHATGSLAAEFSAKPYPAHLSQLICSVLSGFSMQSIDEIITQTELDPKKLAIENYLFPFDITRELIDDLDTGICFDTAHLITRMSGTESVMEFYKTHNDRITEIHLQDGTYSEYGGAVARDDHIPLGRGVMGDAVLREFLLELQKDRFGGPVIFELTKDEAAESLEHIRRVVPEVLS